MDVETTWPEVIIITALLWAAIVLMSAIGNGFFLAIFVRFKTFRNFPNILFANQAIIDFFNALINLPLYFLYFIMQPNWLKGKLSAIVCSSLHLEFLLLNIVSMLALMVDRFLALYLDLKYFTWKTTQKAYLVVSLIWSVCTVLVAAASISSSGLDLKDKALRESRRIIYDDRKELLASNMAIFIAAATVLGMLTSYTIYKKKKKRMLLNLPLLQAEARLKQDIRATKTVAMAVVTYVISYSPAILFAVWSAGMDDTVRFLLATLTVTCTFVSSATNPIIFVFRNTRCRAAIKQLIKDPCGRSPFQERPVR